MDDSLAPRVGAIVQARLGSTRLPGKVLLPLPLASPTTLLGHVLSRAQRAIMLQQVLVATSELPKDDALAQAVTDAGLPVFRGDEQDVLARFYHAATKLRFDVVVRLTADNPAIDPEYIDEAVRVHIASGAAYTVTTGLPLGTNLEVISYAALQTAYTQAAQPEEREHVTPYLRRRPEQFQVATLPFTLPAALADVRLTLDYPSDYAFLHLLFTSLPADFGLAEVADLLTKHPWLARINNSNEQLKP